MDEEKQIVVNQGGTSRYLVKCQKCGYEWLARRPDPKRCALCNNLKPNKSFKHVR
jgi:rubrerythrin